MNKPQQNNFYSQGHLITAAIRILEHQNAAPPSVEKICDLLSFSIEQGHLLCKKLVEQGVLKLVEGSYGIRVYIKDHLLLEEIPNQAAAPTLEEEVEKFKSTHKNFKEKIENFQSRKSEEQKALFAEIEAKFKQKTQGK